ncbi:helix-turn-helix domain-containing protein [Burkholderia contaminans]|nr:helix-turn-helix domain-containing protein [Burkholderia contaminans]
MTAEPWATTEQVALHLGVVKDAVYRCRECKSLPAHKIARLWRFELAEVEWVRTGGADDDSSGAA